MAAQDSQHMIPSSFFGIEKKLYYFFMETVWSILNKGLDNKFLNEGPNPSNPDIHFFDQNGSFTGTRKGVFQGTSRHPYNWHSHFPPHRHHKTTPSHKKFMIYVCLVQEQAHLHSNDEDGAKDKI